jgi:hypothetical protein
MAQGLEVVVSAAEILRDTNVHFCLSAKARGASELEALARRSGTGEHDVSGHGVGTSDAIDYLALSDVVVVPLKKDGDVRIRVAVQSVRNGGCGAADDRERTWACGRCRAALRCGSRRRAGRSCVNLAAAILQLRDDPTL